MFIYFKFMYVLSYYYFLKFNIVMKRGNDVMEHWNTGRANMFQFGVNYALHPLPGWAIWLLSCLGGSHKI